MTDDKEEVVLKFTVDNGDALNQQEKLKAAILNLRQEQATLNKAYKDGSITLQELAQETVRVENNQKSLMTTYRNVSQAITGQKTVIDNLIDSNKKLTESNKQVTETQSKLSEGFKQFSEKAEIGGKSIAGLVGGIASIATPALAAAAGVKKLGDLYFESALGAKDLSAATRLVDTSFTVLSNRIGNATNGNLVTPLAKGLSAVLAAITNNTKQGAKEDQMRSEQAAYYLKQLKDIEIEQSIANKEAAERLLKAKELQEIRDNTNKTEVSITERLQAANEIVEELNAHSEINSDVLKKQVETLIKYGQAVGEINDGTLNEYHTTGKLNLANIQSRTLKLEILNIQKDIALEEAGNQRLISRAVVAQSKLREEAEKELQARKDIEASLKYVAPKTGGFSQRDRDIDAQGDQEVEDSASVGREQRDEQTQKQFDQKLEQQRNEELQKLFDFNHQKDKLYADDTTVYVGHVETKRRVSQNFIKGEQANVQLLQATSNLAGQLLGKNSKAYKAFATAETIASTYFSAQKAFESQFVPEADVTSPIRGAIAAAAAVVEGLANLAQINKVTFAEGGYTGAGGKYQPAGIVHKGEYVVPQSVNYSPAAQPHLHALEGMRLRGYSDGGLVTNMSTQETNSSVMMANAIKGMPQPVVSVKEINLAQARIAVRENVSTL